MMSIEEARKREPYITGQDGSEVLWSPNTSVVDSITCLKQVYKEVQEMNPNFKMHFGSQFKDPVKGVKEVMTNQGDTFEYKHLINCAGL